MIFAFANKSLENYYNEVTQLMDGVAFKDFLKEDNVIQLVKSGYQKVISNVNFFINQTLAEGLKKLFTLTALTKLWEIITCRAMTSRPMGTMGSLLI